MGFYWRVLLRWFFGCFLFFYPKKRFSAFSSNPFWYSKWYLNLYGKVRDGLFRAPWFGLPVRCRFPAPAMEEGPLQNSCDAYSEEFDLLLPSLLIKAQLLKTTMAAAGLWHMFYISLSWQEGKPFYPHQKQHLQAGTLRLEAYLSPVKPVNVQHRLSK